MTKRTHKICRNCQFLNSDVKWEDNYLCKIDEHCIKSLDDICCSSDFRYSKTFFMSLWEPIADKLQSDYKHDDYNILPFTKNAIDMLLNFMSDHVHGRLENRTLFQIKNTYGYNPIK